MSSSSAPAATAVTPVAAPSTTFLATISVTVGTPTEIGPTPQGVRRIIPITGGRVEGPRLRGRVEPVGADYQLLVSETVTELEAKYAITTDEGEHVYVTNFGIRAGSAEDIARLVRGEPVDPERIYFRCSPRMISSGPAWSWLAGRILVGTGRRHPDRVELDVFVLE